MRLRRLAAVLGLFWLLNPLSHALAQSPNVTRNVIGTGASLEDAKTDAIRQALQYTLKQLVVADRVISGDSIVRDRVLSTMNGYVERYSEKSVRRSGAGYVIEAEVTVSPSRIENFLGIVTAEGNVFSGSLLGAQQQTMLAQAKAEEAQAKARGEIFDRLIEDYPTSALDITLNKIDISKDNLNQLQLEMQYNYKTNYLRAVEGTMRALAEHECRKISWASDTNSFDANAVMSVAVRNVDELDCLGTRRSGSCTMGGSGPESCAYKSMNPQKSVLRDTVCLGLAHEIKCFALAKGEYCRSCSVSGKRLAIIGRFLDANGQSAMKGARCVVAFPRYPEQRASLFTFEHGPISRRLVAGFSFRGQRFSIQVDAGKVELQRANSFVAVAAAVREPFFNSPIEVTSLTSGSAASKDPCDLVEAAVLRHQAR